MLERYEPAHVEAAMQTRWQQTGVDTAHESTDRPKYYCLSMLPYPSGKLHMGHVRNYTIGDVFARYHRMLGYNVLHPMGWDAFGLPAENAAMAHRIPAAEWTYRNIDEMREQLQRLGFSFDWRRELATCHPGYYRWEQWVFTKLFEKGLIYKKSGVVNWDPVDHTVLANEQVIDGRGWRSGALVEKRTIPMYYLNIVAYADELLAGLERDLGGWPDEVRTMQKNWIGKSEGLRFAFSYQLDGENEQLWVYTTRPDTIMGISFCAISAEHPLAAKLADRNPAIADFIAECRRGGVAEADLAQADKKGVATGLTLTHPLTGDPLPLWICNYVLMHYGDGAVMAVPAHDERDFAFASRYGLPIRQVIEHPSVPFDSSVWQSAYADATVGRLIHSGVYDGLSPKEAAAAIIAEMTARGQGEAKVHYRLRDWGISRQRYWGCPIPMIDCPRCGDVPVPDTDLPVRLPDQVDLSEPGSPLARMPEFYQTTCPRCGGEAKRETDTLDTFVESSWYFLRYCCNDNSQAMFDQRVAYWCRQGIDQYVGGIEHAVLHLLYARFFTFALRDLGLFGDRADINEPFRNLLTQGMVRAPTFYQLDDQQHKRWLAPTQIDIERDAKGRPIAARLSTDGSAVMIGASEKMSKSKNNGVDPQQFIEHYGADTARLFMMFAAAPDQSLEWSDAGVDGAHRFLRRLWRTVYTLLQNEAPTLSLAEVVASPLSPELTALRRKCHQTIAKVRHDYGERKQFNTAVAAIMECLNVYDKTPLDRPAAITLAHETLRVILLLLFPITPHISEALYDALRPGEPLSQQPFPDYDPDLLAEDNIVMPVQVNGKVRATLTVAADSSDDELKTLALAHPSVIKHCEGKPLKKILVVKGRLISVVV